MRGVGFDTLFVVVDVVGDDGDGDDGDDGCDCDCDGDGGDDDRDNGDGDDDGCGGAGEEEEKNPTTDGDDAEVFGKLLIIVFKTDTKIVAVVVDEQQDFVLTLAYSWARLEESPKSPINGLIPFKRPAFSLSNVSVSMLFG